MVPALPALRSCESPDSEQEEGTERKGRKDCPGKETSPGTTGLTWNCNASLAHWASQVAQWVKNPPAMQEMQETQVRSLGWEEPLEEGVVTRSSTLAWRILWTEEPGGLQSTGLRPAHYWRSWQGRLP